MTIETNSFIFGRAKNPWNQDRTTGGSSGGEAGLIALGGSLVGLGNDIGGSIRIPSSYCGIYGYKPSTKRIFPKGLSSLAQSFDGNKNITVGSGPMARSVNDLVSLMTVLLN